jgi:hypothetical protein
MRQRPIVALAAGVAGEVPESLGFSISTPLKDTAHFVRWQNHFIGTCIADLLIYDVHRFQEFVSNISVINVQKHFLVS